MKYGMDYKGNRVDKFDCHWKKGEVGRVWQFSLLMVPSPEEYHRKVLLSAGNVTSFQNTLHHYGMWSGFSVLWPDDPSM